MHWSHEDTSTLFLLTDLYLFSACLLSRSECCPSSLLPCIIISETCLHPPPTPPQFLEMVIRFLAEGAASGLNVIAVYVTEILRVTGFDGGYQDGPCVTELSSVCVKAFAHCELSAGVRGDEMKVLSSSENMQTCLSLRQFVCHSFLSVTVYSLCFLCDR